VKDLSFLISSSGVPSKIRLPPCSPPPGPRSITQSAHFITSRLCSIINIECPLSIRALNESSNFLISWKCKPVVGSSKINREGLIFLSLPKYEASLTR